MNLEQAAHTITKRQRRVAAARASGRPCVLIGCLHPHDRWGFERPMIYDAIREADAYIALTTYEAAHVVARGARADRVHAIGVGVDAQRFQGLSTEEAKWRLGLDRRPVVGFIGQLAQHKGIDTLLRAMPGVWRYEPEVNLLIAGGRTLFADRVEQIVREWPEAFRRRTKIHLGFDEDQKPELFAAIDVLACPSAFESFGITYLEAWAAGKPVIGARAGAVPTVIDEGTDGLLVDYDDELALAREVVDLLRDPSRAARMGAAGRAKVMARYAWPLIANQYRRVYADVVERSAKVLLRRLGIASRNSVGREDALHPRVGGDDGATRIGLGAEIVERLVEGFCELLREDGLPRCGPPGTPLCVHVRQHGDGD
jgi:glycosyltransferase involved in cell wall biosynthesis